jgi:hypothetical protein
LAQDETNEGEEERRDTESQTEEEQLLAHPFVQTNKLLENLLDVQTPSSLLELDEVDVSPLESFSEFADQEKFVHLADSSPDTSFRKLMSSSVRFLSGVPQKKTGGESKRRNRKLRWHPLRLLDGSSPSATEPLRRRVVDALHRAEEDFMAVCIRNFLTSSTCRIFSLVGHTIVHAAARALTYMSRQSN